MHEGEPEGDSMVQIIKKSPKGHLVKFVKVHDQPTLEDVGGGGGGTQQ